MTPDPTSNKDPLLPKSTAVDVLSYGSFDKIALTSQHPKLKDKYLQPDISIRMLTLAISITKQKRKTSKYEDQYNEKKLNYDNLIAQFANSIHPERMALIIQIGKAEAEYKELLALKEVDESMRRTFEQLHLSCVEAQQRLCLLAKSSGDPSKRKEAIFINFFKLPVVYNMIEALGKKLQIASLEVELKRTIDKFVTAEEETESQSKQKNAASLQDGFRYWMSIDGEADLQLPEFVPGTELTPPPAGGIKVGLTNFGVTCWLSSILKFMSCTPFFDQMMTDKVAVERNKLQALLREIILSLRNGKEVSERYMRALLKEISAARPLLHLGLQQDAPELLLALVNLLRWKPAYPLNQEEMNKSELYPQLGVLYQPAQELPKGLGKYGKMNNATPIIEVTIPVSLKGKEIDLAALIKDEASCQVVPDKLEANAKEIADKKNFMQTSYLINLPKTMIVYLKRFTVDAEKKKNKISTPILLDASYKIPLTRYQPVFKGDKLTGMTAAETLSYRIGAAVIHTGNTEAGHYICMIRNPDGSLIEHNDSKLIPRSEQTFGCEGYLLRLERD